MKTFVTILALTLLIPSTDIVSATKFLMDPMPAHNKAPEFNLIGMDEKIHTLESLEGKTLPGIKALAQ